MMKELQDHLELLELEVQYLEDKFRDQRDDPVIKQLLAHKRTMVDARREQYAEISRGSEPSPKENRPEVKDRATKMRNAREQRRAERSDIER